MRLFRRCRLMQSVTRRPLPPAQPLTLLLAGLVAVGVSLPVCSLTAAEPKRAIPDKLVVLTFDDSVRSHFTQVRPILKRYNFGATFFITEGFDFRTNKKDYMTWKQIAQLHKDGFEIGNHTRDHLGLSEANISKIEEQLGAIASQCKKHGISKPTSFAYPGNAYHPKAFEKLRALGIQFARRGGAPEYPYRNGKGFAYQPGLDHPLLIPSAGDARPNWTMDDFRVAVRQARRGRIAVLQFHGVPDGAHSWVSTSLDNFNAFMKFLAVEKYKVVALRDLAEYVDPTIIPHDHTMVIRDRKSMLTAKRTDDNSRRPKDSELKFWLDNMIGHHRFNPFEVAAATGLAPAEVRRLAARLGVRPGQPLEKSAGRLTVLPYPGGRHPRIGFLDGAIRPQRETKVSVFTPWDAASYVVADIPEAIWHDRKPNRQLLYLAHTHVPTIWDLTKKELKPVEWRRLANGVLEVERELPNKVRFGGRVEPRADGVKMELWITNRGSAKLTGLRVQNCVMLKAASGFNQLTVANKVYHAPFAACRNPAGNRWVITGWERCVRPWGNKSCPCLHADPQFPDCPVGETRRLQGWLSFYEGTDITGELARLKKETGLLAK